MAGGSRRASRVPRGRAGRGRPRDRQRDLGTRLPGGRRKKLIAAKAHIDLGRRLGGAHLYNCTTCAEQPAYLTILGHDGPPSPQLWQKNLITDAPLTECPLRTILRAREAQPELAAEVDRYIDTYYPAYREGHLLIGGGIANQPARYLEFINTLRATQAAVLEKADEIDRINGKNSSSSNSSTSPAD